MCASGLADEEMTKLYSTCIYMPSYISVHVRNFPIATPTSEMTTNATNTCLTVDEGRIYIVVNSLFASLGSLANVLTIFLIVWTKAYRQHVHRLTLYLAILGLGQSIMIGLETLPADTDGKPDGDFVSVRSGWNSACVAIGFVAQHLGLSKSLTVLSVCFYLFMLAICQVKLQKPVYEVSGVLSVIFLPSLVSWLPFIRDQYGLVGVWCWIKYECLNPTQAELGSYFRLGASLIVDIGPHTLSVILISSVAIVFCKRSCCNSKSSVRQQHWLALKEVSPLVSYPLASALSLFFGTVNNVILRASDAGYSRYAGEMMTLCLMQAANLAIPVSFLLHPSVRRSIHSMMRKAQESELKKPQDAEDTTSVQPVTEDATAETSPLYVAKRVM